MSFFNEKIQGTALNQGFKLQAEQPLDARLTVNSLDDLMSLSSEHGAYKGMLVYVEEKQSYYSYDGSNWLPQNIFTGEGESSLQQTLDTETWNTSNKIVKDYVTNLDNEGNPSPIATADGKLIEASVNGSTVTINVGAHGKLSTMMNGKSQTVGGKSHAEGSKTIAFENNSHAEGNETFAAGKHSHAEGNGTSAVGNASHTEGIMTVARGEFSHAEGNATNANGTSSHTEGNGTTASNNNAHAEGNGATAKGENSHAEGYGTTAEGFSSHAEGFETEASGYGSHTEGDNTTASAYSAHAEGYGTKASNDSAHAEGANTEAKGARSHAEGSGTKAIGNNSHTEGHETEAHGANSHAEGTNTKAFKDYSHAEGNSTIADGISSHAEGSGAKASADSAHAEGISTEANGESSHAEGQFTVASKARSHAEGLNTKALGENSHAEGNSTEAKINAHAEGSRTKAYGENSHTEGFETEAIGYSSHAEGGRTKAEGIYSHASGFGSISKGDYQTVIGKANKEDASQAFIIGNGEINSNSTITDAKRKNAVEVDWNGNAWFAGDIKVGTNNKKVATTEDINSAIILTSNIESKIDLHRLDTQNPHNVTAAQVGTYTREEIDEAIANIVDSAPETLDTLNELANALGDDPNFATTIANQIGNKANKTHTHEIARYELSNLPLTAFCETKLGKVSTETNTADRSIILTSDGISEVAILEATDFNSVTTKISILSGTASISSIDHSDHDLHDSCLGFAHLAIEATTEEIKCKEGDTYTRTVYHTIPFDATSSDSVYGGTFESSITGYYFAIRFNGSIKIESLTVESYDDGYICGKDLGKLRNIEAGANKTIVDNELSSASANPVANNIITAEFNQIRNELDINKTQVQIITWEADD